MHPHYSLLCQEYHTSRNSEVDLNSEKYDTPDKAVNNADASVVTDTDGHIADGSIKLGQDANVVVTNTPKNQGQEQDQTFIRISKTKYIFHRKT